MDTSTVAPPSTVDALVDATPATRDRTVDFWRALSIGVVVLWHCALSVIQWQHGALTMPNPVGSVRLLWLVTWVLQVMPLFFIVGGYSNAAALERRDGRTFRRSRLERLLRPVLPYVATWFGVDAVLRLFGAPSVLSWGQVVFVPLWFLAVYTAVVLVAPWTHALHVRGRELTLVVLASTIVLADLLRFRAGIDAAGFVNDGLVFVFAHQLGYWWRDGAIDRRRAWSLLLGGSTALVVLTNLGLYPRAMVATETDALSNMFPTTVCIAALAVVQLSIVVLLRPALDLWLQHRRPWKLVVAANGIAMTVFCWHMTALVLTIGALHVVGFHLLAEPTALWWLERPLFVLLPALVLAVLVRLYARFELRR